MDSEINVSTTIEGSPFSDQQLETMAQWAAEDGIPLSDAPTNSTERVEAGVDVFGNELSPGNFDFHVPPANVEAMDIREQTEVRHALVELGIPVALGNEMARRWNMAIMRPADDAALQLGRQQAVAQLRQTYGDKADEVLQVARAEVERITKRMPFVREVLEQTQLGNDAWIAGTLWNLSEARRNRKG